MCLTPIIIKNPYYGLGDKVKYKYNLKDGVGKNWRDSDGHLVYGHYETNAGSLNRYKNTHETHIQVPCGNCQQCISNKQNFVNQRVQMESLRSHLFMLTLTYNNRSLMHTNCGEYQVAYPYYKDVQNMFKRMRKDGYKFRYYVVSEYGKSENTARPHYHALIAIEKSPDWDGSYYEPRNLEFQYGKLFLRYWKRNYNDNVHPIYDTLLDYKVSRDGRCTYDFHYIEPIAGHDNDTAFYVSKYLWKYDKRIISLLQKISMDDTLDDVQKAYLTKCLKPRSVMSKDFGSWKLASTQSHIDFGLSKNKDLPSFVDLYTGKTSLLSPYYRKHLLPISFVESYHSRLSQLDNSMYIPDDDSLLDIDMKYIKCEQLNNSKARIIATLREKY